jgi:hypothetical protein
MNDVGGSARTFDGFDWTGNRPVGGPVQVAWRESSLTRAKELESLCAWMVSQSRLGNCSILANSVSRHIMAATEAAEAAELRPPQRWRLPHFRSASLRERSMSNLDAAEAQILNFAPAEYVLGQMPGLLRHVQDHLTPANPQRQEFERTARRLGLNGAEQPSLRATEPGRADPARPATRRVHLARLRSTPTSAVDEPRGRLDGRLQIVEEERGKIVTATRAASSAALREQVRVRNFRNVIAATTVLMTLLAIGVAVAGWLSPTMIPLCFAPEESGTAVVVCPTEQSEPFSTSRQSGTSSSGAPAEPGTSAGSDTSALPNTSQDIDDAVRETATSRDLLVVELVGLAAAAVSAAAGIRGIKGSSERHGLLVALAALKLPTGAITAFLGLLLMRGQFIPGLSALDTSAQILAWALVFGYAQQLFTGLVDRQGQAVLEGVGGASRPEAVATSR